MTQPNPFHRQRFAPTVGDRERGKRSFISQQPVRSLPSLPALVEEWKGERPPDIIEEHRRRARKLRDLGYRDTKGNLIDEETYINHEVAEWGLANKLKIDHRRIHGIASRFYPGMRSIQEEYQAVKTKPSPVPPRSTQELMEAIGRVQRQRQPLEGEPVADVLRRQGPGPLAGVPEAAFEKFQKGMRAGIGAIPPVSYIKPAKKLLPRMGRQIEKEFKPIEEAGDIGSKLFVRSAMELADKQVGPLLRQLERANVPGISGWEEYEPGRFWEERKEFREISGKDPLKSREGFLEFLKYGESKQPDLPPGVRGALELLPWMFGSGTGAVTNLTAGAVKAGKIAATKKGPVKAAYLSAQKLFEAGAQGSIPLAEVEAGVAKALGFAGRKSLLGLRKAYPEVERLLVGERGGFVIPGGKTGPQLPRELAGAKPNYNMGRSRYTPQFDSDVDKALFIVSQRNKSRRDASYMGWLRGQFTDLSDEQLRVLGKEVRGHIKTTVRGQPEGYVTIPLSPTARKLGVGSLRALAAPAAPVVRETPAIIGTKPTTVVRGELDPFPVPGTTAVPGKRAYDLDERTSELQGELEEIQAAIRIRQESGVVRPSWAAGLTDEELVAIARQENRNPYQPDWGDAIDSVVRKEAKAGAYKLPGTETTASLKADGRRIRSELAAIKELKKTGLSPKENFKAMDQLRKQEEVPFGQDPSIEATYERIYHRVVDRPGGGTNQNLPNNDYITRKQAAENVIAEMDTAVPESKPDVGATTFLVQLKKLGDVHKAIDSMVEAMGPAFGDPKNPFPLMKGFAEAAFNEVGRVKATWTDTTRLLQHIDRGAFGAAMQRAVLWPTRRLTQASLKFGDHNKAEFHRIMKKHVMTGWVPGSNRKRLREIAADVMEKVSKEDAGEPIEILLGKSKIRKVLGSVRGEPLTALEMLRVVGFARDTRAFLDSMLGLSNKVRIARGDNSIPYRKNYVPWVKETNFWATSGNQFLLKKIGLRFDAKARTEINKPSFGDFFKPGSAFVPHAKKRELYGLAGYLKQRDLQVLIMDYVETARKDIFYTAIIRNAKTHIKQLREMGKHDSAAGVEDWIMEAFAGSQPAISKAIQRIVPRRIPIGPAKWEVTLPFSKQPGLPALDAMLNIRRNLTRAVFPMNFHWNIFTQTNSISLTVLRYGIKDTVRGLTYLVNPSVRNEIEGMYSMQIKTRAGGRLARQDVEGKGIGQTTKLERSPIETVEDFANTLTNLIEKNLTGISIRAAWQTGRRKGLTGRALLEFASEGGSKTQSMYNIEDLPGVLRGPEIKSAFPFQTFSLEMMNTALEYTGQTGIQMGSKPERMLGLAEWLAAVVALAVVSDKAINRQPWQLSSFVPFFSLMTQGLDATDTWKMALPHKYVADFRKGVDDYLKYGSWTRLRTWVIAYHMLGGSQINRTLKGIEAVVDGEVTTVTGRFMFEISDKDNWKVIIGGPYAAAEGRKYVDKLNKDEGWFEKLSGIPSNGNGNKWARKWNSEFKDYFNISTSPVERSDRNQPLSPSEYLKDNPDIDAKLFIAGRVTGLKTNEAAESVYELMKKHNIKEKDVPAIAKRREWQAENSRVGLRVFPNKVDELIWLLGDLPVEEDSPMAIPKKIFEIPDMPGLPFDMPKLPWQKDNDSKYPRDEDASRWQPPAGTPK